MKGWIKKLTAAAMAASLSLCALASCTPNYIDLEMVSKPTMTVQGFDEETGLYTVLVEGLAQNVSGEIGYYANVSVDFYDELGDPIDSYGYQYIDGIDVDEVWHYVILTETEVVPTDFEVSGYVNW